MFLHQYGKFAGSWWNSSSIDVVMNAYDNVQNGASTTEVLSEASVEVFVDISQVAITGAI